MKTFTSVATALILATTLAGSAFAAGTTDSATGSATNASPGAASTETNGPKAAGQVDPTAPAPAPIYMAPNSAQPGDPANSGNADSTSKGKSH